MNLSYKLRWLKKINGERILQMQIQKWTTPTPYAGGYGGNMYPTGEYVWVDVPEIKE